jgi:hypothetical protein
MSLLEDRMKARNPGEQYTKAAKLGIPEFEKTGTQSPSRQFNLTRGAQQDKMLRAQEKDFLKPGASYSRDTFPVPFANYNVETTYLQSSAAKEAKQRQMGGSGLGAGVATTGPAVQSGTGVTAQSMIDQQNADFNAMPEGVAKTKPRTLADIEASRPASPGATRGFTDQVLGGGNLRTVGGPISADQVRSAGTASNIFQGPSGGTYNADGSARGTTGTGLSRQEGGNINFANDDVVAMAQEYRDRNAAYTQAKDRQYAQDLQTFNTQKAQEAARKQYESDVFMGRVDPKVAAENYKLQLDAIQGVTESAGERATTERGQDIQREVAGIEANAAVQAAAARSVMDAVKENRMAMADAADMQYKQARLGQMEESLGIDRAAAESLMRNREIEQELGRENLALRGQTESRSMLGDIESILGDLDLRPEQQDAMLRIRLRENYENFMNLLNRQNLGQ